MIALTRSLWHSRNLLLNLVRRDLTVRYRSTVLGFFWSFAKPLAYMGIYHVIFGEMLDLRVRQPEIPYALHVLAGILPWTFFIGASGEAMGSILASANVVKKVKLPLEVFPAAAVCSHAVHFFLAMTVLVGGMVVVGLAPGPAFLLFPLIALLQLLLVAAVALFLAALNVFFRDVASLWEVIATGWLYATPIIYPAYVATEEFQRRGWDWAYWAFLANPMTPITIAYRRVMLYGALSPGEAQGSALHLEMDDAQLLGTLGMAGLVSLVLLAVAYRVFTRLSRRFADEL